MTTTTDATSSATSTTPTTSTGSSSSGILQSLGIGSGLDISSLVDTLTTSEMNAATSRVTREQADVTSQVSAIATLKSALSTFQTSLTSMVSGSSFTARAVTSSDSTVVTATANGSAALGNYQVQVTQLAQSQQLLSKNFTGGATGVVGTGALTISSSSGSFSINIDSGNNTLAGIRDAINSSSKNQSVSATLVYGQSGAQLVLTSLKTGADSTVSVAATGGDGGLTQLSYGTGNTGNYTQSQAAQDAIVTVSGVEHHSASNQVSDAIDGVTLNLVNQKPGTNISLSIANDTTQVVSLVKQFVSAYNTLQSSLASLDSYDASTQATGPLFGDAMYSSLKNQINHALSDSIKGIGSGYNSLSSLGITTGDDGQLSVDDTRLNTALSSNFKAVSNVFSGANGIVARMNSKITTALLTGGSVASRSASLTTQQSNIDAEKAANDVRTAAVKARYLAKFNAMDSLLSQLQSTSTYLTQQTDALNRASK